MIESLDAPILLFFNRIAGRSPGFDGLVMFASHNGLVKGGFYAVLWWWFWFRHPESRPRVLATSVAAVGAIFLARALALLLPFRVRPADNPALLWQPTTYQSQVHTLGWSSFPSDHAAFFFAFVVGFALISRRAGLLAFLHAVVVICLPRVYLGIHYPTDLAAGAAIGAAAALIGNRERVAAVLAARWITWEKTAPSVFYVGAFLFTYQTAEVFDQALELVFAIGAAAKLSVRLLR